MSLPAIVWLAVGSASLLVMVALTVGLARHVKLLFGSLRDFQDQVSPLAQQTAAEAERASTRTARLQKDVPRAGLKGRR